MNVLILARGGSKGIYKKNISLLNGKPLIYYPINAAKNCKKINNIFVSTDDNEIAEIAETYGATIIKRPIKISGDNSKDIEAFVHFVNETNDYSNIIHLRSTSPQVSSNHIENAIKFFSNDKECTSLRSSHTMEESIFKFYLKKDKFYENIVLKDGVDYSESPRQRAPQIFIPNGIVDIIKPNHFMNNKNLYGNKILCYETEKIIEIDSKQDLEYLNYLLQNKK